MKTGIRAIHVAAILFGIFGLAVAFESRKLGFYYEYGPGPGFLPFGVGISILVFAVWALIEEIVGKDKGKAGTPFFIGWSQSRNVLLAMGAFGFLIISVGIAGFYVSCSLFILFLTKVAERKPWWVVLIVTALVMLFFYLVFGRLLSVQLPLGYFGR